MLHRPKSLTEAIRILADDAEAKALAGGASLVAMLNARLVEPTALVSLSCIEELSRTERSTDGTLRIGAMTRHRDVAEMPALMGTHALLRQAAAAIANPTIRAMGTIGGSIALNDPGADYAPALFALSATVEIVSASQTRTVAAADYFIDWYTTALEPGELVTAIHLPPVAAGVGLYHKLARVAGDFAIVSVAVVVQSDEHVRAVIGGCGPRPLHSKKQIPNSPKVMSRPQAHCWQRRPTQWMTAAHLQSIGAGSFLACWRARSRKQVRSHLRHDPHGRPHAYGQWRAAYTAGRAVRDAPDDPT